MGRELRIFSAGSEGTLVLRTLGTQRTALRDCHPQMRIKWATTSAHKLLHRYWPAHTGVETQLPLQIRQWLTMCRKQMGAKGKSPLKLAPLTINRPSACLTVRHVRNGTLSALLFEELLSELPADWLVTHGLTRVKLKSCVGSPKANPASRLPESSTSATELCQNAWSESICD